MSSDELTQLEARRYLRQLNMPEIGIDGQLRLKQSSILVIGAGGLGIPAAQYLVAAGVGRLDIADYDIIEESNLHRQLLFSNTDIGKLKATVVVEQLHRTNPNVEVNGINLEISNDNVDNVINAENYDVVIDGTDRFSSHYLINDACVRHNKPCVYGSIFRFEGHVSIFGTREGPCYRCIYPNPLSNENLSCAAEGALGAVTGLIGSVQAIETIKLILDQGVSLIGRLLIIDSLNLHFSKIAIKKNSECVTCRKYSPESLRETVTITY
jgi:adenylyltransferase/sulfurtransferase